VRKELGRKQKGKQDSKKKKERTSLIPTGSEKIREELGSE
jgi:hypothetical protein